MEYVCFGGGVCPKDLAIQEHVANSITKYSLFLFSLPVTEPSDHLDVSPRSTSNPVFAVSIAKGSNGLGLGLIDGLVSI